MKHIFFDMDGTITRSRTEIGYSMVTALKSLAADRDVIVVSGARMAQMDKQLAKAYGAIDFFMGQNGNEVINKDRLIVWRRELSWRQQQDIFNYIGFLMRAITGLRQVNEAEWPSPADENDLVQDRGCQVSYSILGHNAPLELKESFDRDGKKRAMLLKEYQFANDTVVAKIGGTTCLDFVDKEGTKGDNIKRMLEKMGWDREDCMYVGDALFPGGNDESVIGVIPTMEVTGPAETLTAIEEILRHEK